VIKHYCKTPTSKESMKKYRDSTPFLGIV